jgi:hypothetical protein
MLKFILIPHILISLIILLPFFKKRNYFFIWILITTIIVFSLIYVRNDITLLNLCLTLFSIILFIVCVININKIEVEDTPNSSFIKFYLIVCLISMLIGKFVQANFFSHRPDYQLEYLAKIKQYKDQFDFNVDSLGNRLIDLKTIDKRRAFYPIIIYTKSINGEIDFDFEFNKGLLKEKRAYTLDSIKTILLIEKDEIYSCTYSNNLTIGYKVLSKISLIDAKSFCRINKIVLEGEDPPLTIKYKKNPPDKVYGKGVSQTEIINAFESYVNR